MSYRISETFNYPYWREEHRSILDGLRDKRVFVLFSGGKDSSLTMDFLLRAGKDFGFEFEAHAGAFPVHRYTNTEKQRIEYYWAKRGANITWHKPADTDEQIENAVNPCLPCQKLRKKMLQTILTASTDDWKSLFLVTSYNLWDIVSYSMEHVLADIFFDHDRAAPEKNKRFMETAQRFYPLLKMKEGYTIFRPLIKYNSNDIRILVEQAGIPTLSIPCKFGDFRPKKILEKYYKKMGLSFDYDHVFDFAKKSLSLPDISSYISLEKEDYLPHLF